MKAEITLVGGPKDGIVLHVDLSPEIVAAPPGIIDMFVVDSDARQYTLIKKISGKYEARIISTKDEKWPWTD